MSTSQIASIAVLGIGGYFAYQYLNKQLAAANGQPESPNYNFPGATSAAIVNDQVQSTIVLPKNTTIIPVSTSVAESWSQEEAKWIADYVRAHVPNLKDPGTRFQTVQVDPVRADQMFREYKQAQLKPQVELLIAQGKMRALPW